jgi:hypothetical protein
MNKTIISILIIAVLLGAVGFLYYTQNKSITTPGTQTDTDTITVTDQTTPLESLRNLMTSGRAVQCTFSDLESQIEGTVKIANQNVRGDFTSIIDGQPTLSHMITSEQTMYLWSDATGGQAMMYDISMITPAAGTVDTGSPDQTGQPSSLDLDKTGNYDCSPWTVDPSVFTPPDNITFSDMSQMMQNMQNLQNLTTPTGKEAGDSGESDPCTACDQLTSDLQTQCRQALNCN